MYQGNYVLGDVLSDLCDRTGCSLGISGDVVELPITLSVKTSSSSVLLASIRNSLISSGYYLTVKIKTPTNRLSFSGQNFRQTILYRLE